MLGAANFLFHALLALAWRVLMFAGGRLAWRVCQVGTVRARLAYGGRQALATVCGIGTPYPPVDRQRIHDRCGGTYDLLFINRNAANRYFIGLIFAGSVLLAASSAHAAVLHSIGEAYCLARHPLEWGFGHQNRKSCEQQHVIQRQMGGGDEFNVIWINTREHDYVDRSKSARWDDARNDRIITPHWLYDGHLKQAYKMGTYANGYHFFIHNYHGTGGSITSPKSSSITLFRWDGVSHLTYLVAGWANFITKEMSYLGYLFRTLFNSKAEDYKLHNRLALLVDGCLSLFFDMIEMQIGTLYGIIGILIGTVFNPIDTVTNIPGGVLLIVETILTGVFNTIGDVIALCTLGLIPTQIL